MAMKRKAKKSRNRGSNQNTRSNGNTSNGFYDRLLGNAMYFSGAIARTGLEFGAEKIQSLAGAARSYSEEQTPQIQEYAELAAKSLDDLATYVSDTDIEQMLDDARDFAHRHPWAVVGAGLAGGVLAAQLLRSSVGHQAGSASGWHFMSSAKTSRKATTPRKKPGRATNSTAHANA